MENLSKLGEGMKAIRGTILQAEHYSYLEISEQYPNSNKLTHKSIFYIFRHYFHSLTHENRREIAEFSKVSDKTKYYFDSDRIVKIPVKNKTPI